MKTFPLSPFYPFFSSNRTCLDVVKNSMVPVPVGLLFLPGIPPQLAADTVDPVLAPPSLCLHAGEGIPTGGDGNVVARVQFETLAAIK